MKFDAARYNLSVRDTRDLIDMWIFGDRERMILKRVILDKVHFFPLSEELGLSEQQVKKIYYREIENLIKHI